MCMVLGKGATLTPRALSHYELDIMGGQTEKRAEAMKIATIYAWGG
ncbi:hypothetical protein ES703_107428 [subsurface metagenome]